MENEGTEKRRHEFCLTEQSRMTESPFSEMEKTTEVNLRDKRLGNQQFGFRYTRFETLFINWKC